MFNIWLLVSLLLDTVPFTYFVFVPVKKQLRFSYKSPFIVWLAASVAVSCFSFSLTLLPTVGEDLFQLVRLLNIVILFAIMLISTNQAKAKATFVFSLIIPFSVGISVVSVYIRQFIPAQTPQFMISSIIRFIIIIVLYPFLIWMWAKIGKEADRITDSTVWHYLWPIPFSAALSELILVSDLYDSTITFADVLGRVVLWVGSVAVCWLLFFLAARYELRIHLQDLNERNELLLSLQEQQYLDLVESIELTRAARHDLRHHLSAIQSMVKDKDYDKLSEYIADIVGHLPLDSRIQICENYAANAVLDHYIHKAKELGIPIKVNFRINNKVGVADTDLCVLLGNTVENAIEATTSLPPEKRFISISAIEDGDRIYMTFDNSYDGETRQSQGGYLSKKRGFSSMGVGMTSVNVIVKKYCGDMKIETIDGVFRLSVMLMKNSV